MPEIRNRAEKAGQKRVLALQSSCAGILGCPGEERKSLRLSEQVVCAENLLTASKV
jgi:hypothetical protein